MAGTLFGLGLSQRVTLNGLPEAGWLLYIYDTGTSTPASTYSDTGLTTALSFPIEADSYGMMPDFWVADGTYRARATNSAGSAVFFDKDAILAIGPSTGSGGSSSTVDPDAVLQTGDMFWKPVSGSRSGCVRANGLTIGSVSSGGVERAAADTQPLYEYLWNNFTNAICPVTSGRGGSATADFTAGKPIATFSMRGYAPYGLDDMGNSAAGVITGGTTAAATGGGQSATVLTANLPNISLVSSSLSAQLHSTALTATGPTSFGANFGAGGTNVYVVGGSAISGSVNNGTVDITGTVPLGGSGTALATISPYRLGTWYIKL